MSKVIHARAQTRADDEPEAGPVMSSSRAREIVESLGLLPTVKAIAKRKPRNTPEQAALIARTMKAPKP